MKNENKIIVLFVVLNNISIFAKKLKSVKHETQ